MSAEERFLQNSDRDGKERRSPQSRPFAALSRGKQRTDTGQASSGGDNVAPSPSTHSDRPGIVVFLNVDPIATEAEFTRFVGTLVDLQKIAQIDRPFLGASRKLHRRTAWVIFHRLTEAEEFIQEARKRTIEFNNSIVAFQAARTSDLDMRGLEQARHKDPTIPYAERQERNVVPASENALKLVTVHGIHEGAAVAEIVQWVEGVMGPRKVEGHRFHHVTRMMHPDRRTPMDVVNLQFVKLDEAKVFVNLCEWAEPPITFHAPIPPPPPPRKRKTKAKADPKMEVDAAPVESGPAPTVPVPIVAHHTHDAKLPSSGLTVTLLNIAPHGPPVDFSAFLSARLATPPSAEVKKDQAAPGSTMTDAEVDATDNATIAETTTSESNASTAPLTSTSTPSTTSVTPHSPPPTLPTAPAITTLLANANLKKLRSFTRKPVKSVVTRIGGWHFEDVVPLVFRLQRHAHAFVAWARREPMVFKGQEVRFRAEWEPPLEEVKKQEQDGVFKGSYVARPEVDEEEEWVERERSGEIRPYRRVTNQ